MSKKLITLFCIIVMMVGVTHATDLVSNSKQQTISGYTVKAKSAIETGRNTGYAESTGDRTVFSRSVSSTFYYLDTHNNVVGSTNKNMNIPKGTPLDCRVSYTTSYSYHLIYKVSSSHNITEPINAISWTPNTECIY